MFKIDNEFQNANISRTIRFTEKLFDELSMYAAKIIYRLIILCCSAANMRWIILTIPQRPNKAVLQL